MVKSTAPSVNTITDGYRRRISAAGVRSTTITTPVTRVATKIQPIPSIQPIFWKPLKSAIRKNSIDFPTSLSRDARSP